MNPRTKDNLKAIGVAAVLLPIFVVATVTYLKIRAQAYSHLTGRRVDPNDTLFMTPAVPIITPKK